MDKECTIYRTADFIGKRWTLPILLEIYKGRERTRRYSSLKGSIPAITPKVLSARLKELEREGMVSKKVYAETFPIKSEYSLTESGSDFIKVIKDVKKWAIRWKPHIPMCTSADCSKCEL